MRKIRQCGPVLAESAQSGQARSEGYLMGCTFSFYKSRGVTLLGRENREILHNFALINEFHRLAPAGRALSALPLPFTRGGSIQCTSRLGDGTHLNANVNGVSLHWK